MQTLILLVFNSQKTQTLRQLVDYTGLNEETLAPSLAVLAAKSQDLAVLVKVGEAYSINESFKSAQKRLSLNKLPKTDRKSKEEVKETEDRVREDRRFQIEAIIMKIMKDKKALGHADLIRELLKKVNFPLDDKIVKQRIESLIEKDYIKRAANDAGTYEYIA